MSTQPCPHCGNPLRVGAKFCAKCGRAVIIPPTPLSKGGKGGIGVTCPKCGTQNRAGAKFCKQCKTALTAQAKPQSQDARVRCGNCGAMNRVGAKFCSKCRSDLPAGALTPPSAPPLRGEGRRGAVERGQFTWQFAAAGAAVIVLCTVIGIGAWFATNGGKKIASGGANVTQTLVASDATTAPTTPLPVGTPLPAPTSIASDWQTFAGTGYTLNYPQGWYAYQSAPGAEQAGVRYDLILSNAAGNQSTQSATPDESARVTIAFLPKPTQPLDQWVAQRWAWLDTPLTSVSLDGAPALIATAASSAPPLVQEFYWVDYRGQYYTVNAYARADAPDALDKIKKVMDSFKLKP